MINTTPSQIIDKEQIPKIKFSKEETLTNKKSRSLRAYYLRRASQLGNLFKSKVRIYFKNQQNELFQVNTTIWGDTSEFIILKQGITIPKSSIVYVE